MRCFPAIETKVSLKNSLPETNSQFAPENRPFDPIGKDGIPTSNHPFLGAKLQPSIFRGCGYGLGKVQAKRPAPKI